MNDNIGALWVKEGKKGDFYSGYIEVENGGKKEKIRIVVFKNNYKNKETSPDFQILKSKMTEEEKYKKEEREAIQNEKTYDNEEDYAVDSSDLPF